MGLSACGDEGTPSDPGTTTGDTSVVDTEVQPGDSTTGDDTGSVEDTHTAETVDTAAPPPDESWDRISLGTTETVRAVWGPGDGSFYACGDHGALLWFNGSSWTPLPHLTDADLYGISGLPGGDVYVVGAGGTLLRKDNAGWNVLDTGVSVDLHGVHAVSSTQVHLVGDEGTILRFDGQQFKAEASNTTRDIRSIFVPPGGAPLAGGAGGQVYKFSGGQWIATQAAGSQSVIQAIWGTSAQFVVAVGTEGLILTSTGAGWSVQTSNDIQERDLYGVWGTANNDVYCVGDGGTVIGYNGSKWTVVETDGPLFTTTAFRGVWGSTAGEETTAFAVGAQGGILSFDGDKWLDSSNATDVAILDIVTVNTEQFVAVGEHGLLLRWRESVGWTGLASGVEEHLNAAQPATGGVIAVGDAGVAFRLDELDRVTLLDSGTSKGLLGLTGGESGEPVIAVGMAGIALRVEGDAFTVESTGTISHLRAVHTSDSIGTWAVGDQGTVLQRSAEGSWSKENPPTSANLNAIQVLGDGVWVGGDNGVILHYAEGTWTKENESPAEFIYGLWGDDAGQLLAVGWTGLVLRRTTDGAWITEGSTTVNVLEAIDGVSGGPVWVSGRKGTLLRRR